MVGVLDARRSLLNQPKFKLPGALPDPAADAAPSGADSVISALGGVAAPVAVAEKSAEPEKAKKPKKDKTPTSEAQLPADAARSAGRFVPIDDVVIVEECDGIRAHSDGADDKSMETLVAAIKSHGILNPLLVESDGEGKYRLLDGHRRLTAAKELKLDEVPVTLVDTERQRTAVAKIFGLEPTKIKTEHVRKVLGVIANTARRQLKETDVSRAMREMFKDDVEHKFVNKTNGKLNVRAVAQTLGTSYDFTRARVAVIENFNEEQVGRLQAAVDKTEADPKLPSFSWSTVFAALLRPRENNLEFVRMVAEGKINPEDARKKIDGADEDGDAGEGGDGEPAEKEKNPNREQSVRVGTKILEGTGVEFKLVGASGQPARAVVTVDLKLDKTVKQLDFDGPRGKAFLDALTKDVATALAEALTGKPRTKPKGMPDAAFKAEVEADEKRRRAELAAAWSEAAEAVGRKIQAAREHS